MSESAISEELLKKTSDNFKGLIEDLDSKSRSFVVKKELGLQRFVDLVEDKTEKNFFLASLRKPLVILSGRAPTIFLKFKKLDSKPMKPIKIQYCIEKASDVPKMPNWTPFDIKETNKNEEIECPLVASGLIPGNYVFHAHAPEAILCYEEGGAEILGGRDARIWFNVNSMTDLLVWVGAVGAIISAIAAIPAILSWVIG